MKWCKQCKVSYDDSAFYCLKCGSPLVSHEQYIESLENEIKRLQEEREEKENRNRELNQREENTRKIKEIEKLLSGSRFDIGYLGRNLSEYSTDRVNAMYDIYIKRKYNGYTLSEMIDKDKEYIRNKLPKIQYYCDEIMRRTRYNFDRDISRAIKTGIQQVVDAVLNGGRFKAYEKKPSKSIYYTGMDFDTYSYEVK